MAALGERFAQRAGGGTDLFRREIGDRGGPLRGELRNMGDEFVEPRRPGRDVVGVVEAFVDEDVHPSQQQSRIGSGPDR